MESGGITHTKTKTKRGERDCTDEVLALLNNHKALMNLWRALISALETESKPLKKPLPRVFNINLLKNTEELLVYLQSLLIATYPAIVRVLRSNLAEF